MYNRRQIPEWAHHVFLGEEEISDVSLAMAARNVSYDGEHKLAERLQLLPLWGLQGLPWHHISRWRPQCQSAQ